MAVQPKRGFEKHLHRGSADVKLEQQDKIDPIDFGGERGRQEDESYPVDNEQDAGLEDHLQKHRENC